LLYPDIYVKYGSITFIKNMTETKVKKATKEAQSDKLAVIRSGSKQYLVREGQTIKMEKILDKEVVESKKVSFDVLMVAEGEEVSFGTPTLKNKVEGELVGEGRDKKVNVVRYKAKSRYFTRRGHRQHFILVKITKIA
jgi:large subunit ribosomal protein L21